MTSLRGFERTEFPLSVRKAAFKRACKNGVPCCEKCGKEIRAGHLIYEHLKADGLDGEPTLENCGVYCDVCADKKTVEHDNPIMQKSDRQLKGAFGLRGKKRPIRSQGFAKSVPQRRATSPVERRS